MKRGFTYLGLLLIVLLSSCDGVSLSRSDSGDYGYYNENSIGGSLASFALDSSGNSLYTIQDGQLVTYDVSNPANSITKVQAYVTTFTGQKITNLETIFPYRSYLCLGAMDGMYIVDVSNPSSPKYISKYEHVVSCDPVVVQDDIAYVTLRKDNRCWQDVNELHVVDISDAANPKEIQSYPMVSPYGLGVDGDLLFICDDNKLKVFNCSDPANIVFIEGFDNITATDVIPFDSVLMVLGEAELNQYSYSAGRLTSLSSITNSNK